MQQPASIIQIRDLNVHYGNSHTLKNIQLDIPQHGITSLLGPSGCGKTTLLKSLNRLTDLYPSMKVSGQIWVDGEDILSTKRPIMEIRQKMVLLAQRPFVFPMSILENVTYGLTLHGKHPRSFLEAKAEQHLKEVGLWEEVKDRLKSPASGLSIGQQQRLCLARGLAIDPEIILADEPTSALDPISSNKIEEQLMQLKEKYTIILVTHTLRQAKRLSDHVVFMYFGEIVEQGHPSLLFSTPQTPTLKRYLEVGH